MTCVGHTNSCPSHAGYDPAVSAILWPDAPLGTGINVKGYYHYYYLVYYIQSELDRRSVSPPGDWWVPYSAGNLDTDDTIFAADYLKLRDALQACKPGDWDWATAYVSATYLAAGEDILDESTNGMRDRIDVLRAECICNCNYACTCNCNYCTCNCNYACTCNCNYSDKRLKEEIVYL